MVKRLIICVLVIAGALSDLRAQDPQFSQYYAAPLYLNPAFVGSTNHHRFVVNHRLQWPSLPQTFATYAFSYDLFRADLRSGFGMLATTDKAGTAGLRSTNVGFMYSYKIPLPNNWVMAPGLYFGYSIRDLNFNRLLFGDQVEFDQDGVPSLDPALAKLGNTQFFDFASGILMYNLSVWIGVSAWHMNTPNISLLNQVNELPMKFTVHGGGRIQLWGGRLHNKKVSHLTPSFVYRVQGPFDQLDLGLHYHVDPIMVGFWYRGIPIQKNTIDNVSQDAIVFTMGLQFSLFEFGYSYDFTVSELGVNSGGAHEVSLEYEFELVSNPRKVKRKDKIIPCPSFTPKASPTQPFRKNY